MNFIPKISIIIPVFNGALLIKRCLDSVVTQKGNFDLEIIVIDDGSTDNSIEIISNYPHFIKLIQQPNQGPAAARNKGIEAASGKYLAFLDADDYWKPEFLKETVVFLENNLEAIAVSIGQMHKIPGKKDSVSPNVLTSDPERFTEPMLLKDFYTFWAVHNHVCTGSVLMRTSFVKKSGGQRPELRITEDLEFWAYLATFGNWGFIPKVLLVTDGGEEVKKNGYIQKNKKRWKNAPSIEEWESRIVTNLDNNLIPSFSFARWRIASRLIYSYLQTFRVKLAHQTVKKYYKNYPIDNVSKLYILCSRIGYFVWFIISLLFIIREYWKSLKYKF